MKCGCSIGESKKTEDLVRDLINIVNVRKAEEADDVVTRIEPATAKELVAKLKEIAKQAGKICVCR